MAGFSFAAWGNDLYTGHRSYPVVAHRKRWFTVAAVLAAASILLLVFKPLQLGIDFQGGTEITVENVSTTEQGPANDAVRAVLPGEEPRVASVGASALRIQVSALDDAQVNQLGEKLADAYGIDPQTDMSVSTIGRPGGRGSRCAPCGVWWCSSWLRPRSWRCTSARGACRWRRSSRCSPTCSSRPVCTRWWAGRSPRPR